MYIETRNPGTTPADALDVMNKLVEKGKWVEFCQSARREFWKGHKGSDFYDASIDFMLWLFSPDSSGVYRICELAGEFIKERG
jgi:hypothetical protein